MAEINGNSPTVRERVLDQEQKHFSPKGRVPMPRTGVLQQRQGSYNNDRSPTPRAGTLYLRQGHDIMQGSRQGLSMSAGALQQGQESPVHEHKSGALAEIERWAGARLYNSRKVRNTLQKVGALTSRSGGWHQVQGSGSVVKVLAARSRGWQQRS
jgi:hypothetical protein